MTESAKARYNQIKITQDALNKYSKEYGSKFLSHFRCNENTDGIIIVEKRTSRVIGAVNIEKKNDGIIWIQALEINKAFQRKGYGQKLLQEALRRGATDLSVRKSNIAAIKLYLKNGFIAYKETDSQYYMSNRDRGNKIFISFNSEESVTTEATLTAAQRKEIPDKQFGIPSQRRYPLNDRNHVMAAIRMFNRVDRKHEKELAYNILKAMKHYNIDTNIIGDTNRLRSYIR